MGKVDEGPKCDVCRWDMTAGLIDVESLCPLHRAEYEDAMARDVEEDGLQLEPMR